MQTQRDGLTPWNPLDDLRWGYHGLLLIAFIWAVPVTLLMRKVGTIGSRHISWCFPVGILWIVIFGAFVFPHEPPEPLAYFAIFTAALLVLHWLKRNSHGHSLYCGDSGLGQHPRASTFWEPLLFIVVGLACQPVALALGTFLIGAGLASHVLHSHLDRRDQARLRALHDARLEQQSLMTEYHKEHD